MKREEKKKKTTKENKRLSSVYPTGLQARFKYGHEMFSLSPGAGCMFVRIRVVVKGPTVSLLPRLSVFTS